MKILGLCPHIDDEMGILPFIFYSQKNLNVEYFVFYFSDCQKSTRQLGFSSNVLRQENKFVIKSLGVPSKNVFFEDYPVRDFFKFRQNILERMIEFRENIQPDIVLLPGTKDIHQDHKCIFEEGCRCFKNHATLIGFSYPWNSFEDVNNIFIEIDKVTADKIVSLLGNYKSQKTRLYMKEDFIRANFIANGIKIGKPMAVGYEFIKGRFCL